MLRFLRLTIETKQGLLLFGAGLAFLFQDPALAYPSKSCGQILFEINSLPSARAKILKVLEAVRAKVPYVYFDPLPQMRFHLDTQAIDNAKTDYKNTLEVIKQFPETKINPPKNNEERVALLEAVAETIDNAGWTSAALERFRTKRERDLIKTIDRWKIESSQLTQEALDRLFDLHYLEVNAEAIRWFRVGDIANPSPTMMAIARERWKATVARENMREAFEKLGFFRKSSPWSDSLRMRVDRLLRFTGRAFVNVSTFMTFHVPAFFPQLSLFKIKAVREKEKMLWRNNRDNPEQAEIDYLLQFQDIQRVEYFKDWAAKAWPYVITAVLAVNTFTAYQRFQKGYQRATNLPVVERTESRASIETTLTQAMLDEYKRTHGEPANAAATASIHKYVAGLKLREQVNLRKKLRPEQ